MGNTLSKIFLSYNRQNLAFVDTIAKRLEENSYAQIKEVFFDQDDIGGGDNWVDQIQKALSDSDACIVFIGEKGIGKWQNKEVLTAVSKYVNTNGEFKIIPVIIPHSNREDVQKNFPWLLSDIQWIEFSSETDPDAFLKLVHGLQKGEKPAFPISGNAIPYKGLDFFDVEDAPFFFGRTFDVNWVFYKKLRLNSKTFGNRFLAVVGDSGSGKSSFARAGLLAALKAGRFTGSEAWKQVILTPEDNPLLKLASTLQASGIVGSAKEMEDEAKNDKGALRRRLEVYGKKLILFVDQFEEVITQCRDHNLQMSFLDNLAEGLKSEYLVCILTLRSDFYAAFAAFPVFADLLENSNYTLTGMDFKEGNDDWERYMPGIIQKPAKLAGVKFEDTLARQMLEDIKGINGILPALELALKQIWNKRKNNTIITSEDYDNLSKGRGIGGIIEEHANNVLNLITLKNKDRINLVKAVFIRLVEITHNREDVRKTIKKKDLIEELAYLFKEPKEIENILTELSGPESRLLRIKKDSNGDDWVEVIHEVLIRQWEQLRNWLNDRREALTYKSYLEQYIEQDGSLFTDRKLTRAEEWKLRNGDICSKRIADFLKKSRTQSIKKKSIVIGIFVFIAFACIAAWYYIPIYKILNSDLARENYITWMDEIDEKHSLQVKSKDDLKLVKYFSNLDNLIIINNTRGTISLIQSDLDKLPQRLQSLTINDFTLDSSVNLLIFKHLHSLEINNAGNLKTLKGFPTDSLYQLTINRVSTLHSLSGIENLNTIKSLKLSDLQLQTGLSGIEYLKGLKSLELENVYYNYDIYTRKGITNLSDIQLLDSLQTLTLKNLDLLTSLSGIEKLQALQSLKLSNLKLLTSLNGIGNLRGIQSLTLEYLDSLTSLTGIGSSTAFKSLTINNIDLLTNLSGVENLTSLISLNLSLLKSLNSLHGIDRLSALDSLSLSSLNSLKSLTGIEKLEGLKSLTLMNINSLTSLQGIEKLQALQSLNISSLESLKSLAGIEKLEGLKSLVLTCYYKKELTRESSMVSLVRPDLSELKAIDTLQMLTRLDLHPLTSMRGIENLKIIFFLNYMHYLKGLK